MSKKKYYQSNLTGSFTVPGVGEIPGPPSYLTTTDEKKQELLKNHPRNGFRVGFSEVDGPKPVVTQKADGTQKQTEKVPKNAREPKQPEGEEVSADGPSAEDVTNAQQAKKYLLEVHGDEVDGRTLTTAAKIKEASKGLVEFPNWK